jgi:hypothetical protein
MNFEQMTLLPMEAKKIAARKKNHELVKIVAKVES